jgi:hypothetical protein
MAQKIQVRRGLRANLPFLSPGEFGLCTDTKELFVGVEGETIKLLSNISSEDRIDKSEPIELIDETPPEKISGLMIYSIDKTTIGLKWKKSPSRDVASYSIYDGITLLGTTENTYFILNGLTPGMLYNFSVKAKDGWNNESIGVETIMKTDGPDVLSFGGTNEYVVTPILNYNTVEMICSVNPISGVDSFFVDGRNGMPRIYYSRKSTGYDDVGLDWTSVYFNGTLRRLGSSNLQDNTKTTIRLEFTDPITEDIHFFSNLTNQYPMRGKLYKIKVMNGDAVVAYYDFTQRFVGTSIPDLSGNGQNATLFGGTWVSES